MAWPTLRIISFINGIFLLTLAISMTIPMLTLVLFGRPHELNAFLWSSLITFIAGMTMLVQGRPKDVQLRPRDMYLLTVSSWVLVGLFAALPFMFSQHLGLTDAVFESMSGITATGATGPGGTTVPRRPSAGSWPRSARPASRCWPTRSRSGSASRPPPRAATWPTWCGPAR